MKKVYLIEIIICILIALPGIALAEEYVGGGGGGVHIQTCEEGCILNDYDICICCDEGFMISDDKTTCISVDTYFGNLIMSELFGESPLIAVAAIIAGIIILSFLLNENKLPRTDFKLSDKGEGYRELKKGLGALFDSDPYERVKTEVTKTERDIIREPKRKKKKEDTKRIYDKSEYDI